MYTVVILAIAWKLHFSLHFNYVMSTLVLWS